MRGLMVWLCLFACIEVSAAEPQRPNILWLTTEDIGPQLGCYGDRYADTPRLDQFASSSTRYVNAWSNAPVCAPARTTIISGIYPPSSGGEHMRSMFPMPRGTAMYPTLLKGVGYFCVNLVKEDYNLQKPNVLWDEAPRRDPWPTLKQHQPFMAVINNEGTHESRIRTRPHTLKHDPLKAPLPKYHPDTPDVRHDWAQYYDNITSADQWFGEQIDAMKEAGLADDTIVFFYGDHGAGMPRSKRFPYNSGLSVPLLVHIPEKFKELAASDMQPGGVSSRLVSFVDLAPTLLSLVGKPAPEWMQGKAFMGKYDASPREYLFGFRGRMDERYDMIRTVRNERYQYIRNYYPHLPHGAPVNYMFQQATTRDWHALHQAGKLNEAQNKFWEQKPPEELYDLQQDPDEVVNLIDSAEHQAVLQKLRTALRDHIFEIRDVGFLPEDELTSRAPGEAPYDLAHDPQRYPLDAIYAMAEAATNGRADAADALIAGLSASDSAVRFWAAMGLLMRGEAGYKVGGKVLQRTLESDPSPSVRIVVAQILGQYGSESERQSALAWLVKAADPAQQRFAISLMAVNALDALGTRAAGVEAQLLAYPDVPPPPVPQRQTSYYGRVREHILSNLKKQTP